MAQRKPQAIYGLMPATGGPRGTWPAGAVTDPALNGDQLGLLDAMVVRKWNRRPPSSDYDLTRRQYRRLVNVGATNVQLNCGTQKMLRSGYRWPYRGAGWYTPVPPLMPGFEPTFAGYPPTGPDPWSMARLWVQGPGQDPVNPGGPATIGAYTYENPMTG